MMGLLTTLNEAKGAVLAVAAVGGGALGLNQLHVPRDEYDAYVASNRVQTILSIKQQAAEEGSPEYLCRALEQEFAALCTEQPKHYFCAGPEGKAARDEILAKAGCGG